MMGLVVSLAMTMQGGLPDQVRLKADFNKSKGKVRVVMLVSPT